MTDLSTSEAVTGTGDRSRKFAKDAHTSGAGVAASTVNDRMVMVAALLEAAVVGVSPNAAVIPCAT